MQCEGELPDTTIRISGGVTGASLIYIANVQFVRCTNCNKHNYYDDENQIARESVFRAERIPERIDRPLSVLCPDADCQHSV